MKWVECSERRSDLVTDDGTVVGYVISEWDSGWMDGDGGPDAFAATWYYAYASIPDTCLSSFIDRELSEEGARRLVEREIEPLAWVDSDPESLSYLGSERRVSARHKGYVVKVNDETGEWFAYYYSPEDDQPYTWLCAGSADDARKALEQWVKDQ